MTHELTPCEPTNAYRRDGYDWPHGDVDDVAVAVTDRLAVLPDGIFLRRNPPDQPTVEDVLHKGSRITADHRTDDHVSEVCRVIETETYGVTTYKLLVGELGKETRDDGLLTVPRRQHQGAR